MCVSLCIRNSTWAYKTHPSCAGFANHDAEVHTRIPVQLGFGSMPTYFVMLVDGVGRQSAQACIPGEDTCWPLGSRVGQTAWLRGSTVEWVHGSAGQARGVQSYGCQPTPTITPNECLLPRGYTRRRESGYTQPNLSVPRSDGAFRLHDSI